jgi:hypothetical protein
MCDVHDLRPLVDLIEPAYQHKNRASWAISPLTGVFGASVHHLGDGKCEPSIVARLGNDRSLSKWNVSDADFKTMKSIDVSSLRAGARLADSFVTPSCRQPSIVCFQLSARET